MRMLTFTELLISLSVPGVLLSWSTIGGYLLMVPFRNVETVDLEPSVLEQMLHSEVPLMLPMYRSLTFVLYIISYAGLLQAEEAVRNGKEN